MGRWRSRWRGGRSRGIVAAVVVVALGMVSAASVPALASSQHSDGSGQVTSWQQYVVAPSSRDVLPVRVLSTSGDVQNPVGVLGNGVATFTATPPPTWPAGTTATASSYHTPNTVNGQVRTYVPTNAIDGNTQTFWNDATPATYPAWLIVTSPAAVTLPGITVLSNSDGVPVDYTVATWNGTAWVTQATVTGNSAIERQVPFPQPVSTTQVQITVTQDQNTPQGEYTRINEVYPGLAPPAPSVTVDFGKDVAGFPRLNLAGASTNHPGLELAFSETTQYLTNRSDFTRSDNGDTITPGTDQVAVPSTPQTWTDTHGCADGTQVCDDGLHGFRYMKITLAALASDAPYTQDTGTVKISGVSLDFTPYLGTPSTYKGWFLSSNTQLNKYWYGASYTDELGTDTFLPDTTDPRNANSPTLDGKTVIFDGAKRDRDPYDGDIAVSGLTDYLTHANGTPVRNVLADLADHQRGDGWIPPASIANYTLPLFDYPMWWAVDSWEYVLYTGDTGYASTYLPNLVKLLNTWYPSVTDSNGLLDKGLNGTSGYGDYAFLPRSGEVTYYNALYVMALNDASQMAKALGDTSDATAWAQRAQTVSSAINANLWDPAAGAYLDSNTGPVSHPQDGNAMAIMAGVADPSRAASALSYLAKTTAQPYGNAFFDNNSVVSDGSQRVYAFTSFPEIEARFQTGRAGSALNEIQRLYGWMYGHDPGITDWEGIGAGGSMYEGAFTSAAHGWSTGVVPELTNEMLGVMPTSPGFGTWSVKPHPGLVSWAEGQIPTPHGPLLTHFGHPPAQDFTVSVTAPRGTSGDISVPVTNSHVQVIVNGRVAWASGHATAFGAGLSGGYVTLHGIRGGATTTVIVRAGG
ncbi:MAG TPA: alpha-L-rhamnosidase C-terminal domain-containing protein [Streptosporangiaceae bacterium]|nr:alpha-L-rhamnosidase C-terminal domain-containing protein [Streptosporangiaceae bacterium]